MIQGSRSSCRKSSALHHLSDGNRRQINRQRTCAPTSVPLSSYVLKVAAEDQFETVRHGPRVPVMYDLGD